MLFLSDNHKKFNNKERTAPKNAEKAIKKLLK